MEMDLKHIDISENDFKKALEKATKAVSKSKRGEEKRFIRDLISFVGADAAKELNIHHCWCGPIKWISDNKVKCLFSCEPDEDSHSVNFDVDLTVKLGTDDKNRIWSKHVRFTSMYVIKDSKLIKKLSNGTQFYKENNIKV